MNKKLMIIGIFVIAGSVSAWPGWMCRSKKSVDAVKPQVRPGRRPRASDAGVTAETVIQQNPYHVARERFEKAPDELRAAAREARRSGRTFQQVSRQAKDQHSSDFARTHDGIRRDAHRTMIRSNKNARYAFDSAAALDERAEQARDSRREVRKRFQTADNIMNAWARKKDENPTAS